MDITRHGDGLVIGSYQHVVVNILRGAPGVTALEHVLQRTREVAKVYPARQVVLNILETSAFLPNPGERSALAAKIKELETTTKASNILVIEAKSFGAVAFRAVIAGLSFLAGSAQVVCNSIDDAVKAAVKDVPAAERAEFVKQLLKTIQDVRQA